jgi:hypothetical protein
LGSFCFPDGHPRYNKLRQHGAQAPAALQEATLILAAQMHRFDLRLLPRLDFAGQAA